MIGTKEGITFYRCTMCHKVVSPWDINTYYGCKCGNKKITETNLTIIEKMIQLVKHPAFWKWANARTES